MPYLAYDEVDFDVPVYPNGDVYDRYKVHMDEMRTSARIVAQCVTRLEEMRGEPWIADDRKVVLPPREELHTSMESLIHHFKIVTEGYHVPEGEVYVAIESARGECGCYLVSDGGTKPWRVKFRAPSFAALQATATCVRGTAIADLVAVAASLDPSWGTSTGERRRFSRRGAADSARRLPETRSPRCSPRSGSRRSRTAAGSPRRRCARRPTRSS